MQYNDPVIIQLNNRSLETMTGNPFSGPDTPSRASSAVAPSSTSLNPLRLDKQSPRKKHKAGRKHKRMRRKSFAVPANDIAGDLGSNDGALRSGFYAQGGNASNTSIDSEALLDHRYRSSLKCPIDYTVSRETLVLMEYLGTTNILGLDVHQLSQHRIP